MLSIGSMSPGQGSYYLNLAKGDYYTQGGEPLGQWYGAGAARLGLAGVVEEQPFYHLLTGVAPDGRSILVKAPPGKEHNPGWDLTFSAPKSVSVFWAQADEATRQRLQELHEQAVTATLDYLAETAYFSRRGRGGRRLERVEPVFALFRHGTSRAEDPQLHTHALALNLGLCGDAWTGAVAGSHFYDQKMALGALYRAELAHQLQMELGLEVRRHRTAFELVGVSQALIQECSKRRQAVLHELQSKGFESARAAAAATLSTRTVKRHRALGELLGEWQAKGRELGFSAPEVERLLGSGQLDPATEPERARGAVERAVARLVTEQNYFTEAHLVRATAEEAQWCGVGLEGTLKAVDGMLSSDLVQRLGTFRKQGVYTTQEVLDLEEELYRSAERVAGRRGLATARPSLTLLVDRLSAEQREVLDYLLSPPKLCLVDGLAGTGKTRLLRQARRGWELGGRQVIGAAVSAVAAQGLAEETGMRTMTLEELIVRLGGGEQRATLGHHVRMLWRASQGRSTWTPGVSSLTLTRRTVIVLDEASMVSTPDLNFLLQQVDRAGAKLTLVGDRYQLAAIENGGCFAALADKHGAKRLRDVRRQRDKWAREAVKELADGDVEKGLKAYAERGLVEVMRNREEALQELLWQWRRDGVRSPQRHVMLTGTNEEVDQLNAAAQAERQQAGKLGHLALRVGETTFHANDRVAFHENARQYGVLNGDTGRILMVDPLTGNMIVSLDRGRWRYQIVGIPTRCYKEVTLGYALTTHCAQGSTFDHVYVMAGGFMQDREMAYVQLSRARVEARLFCGEQEAGEELAGLVKQFERSREQVLATELRNSALR